MVKKGMIAGMIMIAWLFAFLWYPRVHTFAEGPVDIEIVELVEEGAGYKPWQDIAGAMPGMTYSAIPMVRNDGEEPVAVKMCLSWFATNKGGDEIILPSSPFEIEIKSGWVLMPGETNCYGYSSELAVGATTEPIFTEVSLDAGLGNEYQGATFSLRLAAETILEPPVVPEGAEGAAGDGTGNNGGNNTGDDAGDTGQNPAGDPDTGEGEDENLEPPVVPDTWGEEFGWTRELVEIFPILAWVMILLMLAVSIGVLIMDKRSNRRPRKR